MCKVSLGLPFHKMLIGINLNWFIFLSTHFHQGVKLLSTVRIGTEGRTRRDMTRSAKARQRKFPPRCWEGLIWQRRFPTNWWRLKARGEALWPRRLWRLESWSSRRRLSSRFHQRPLWNSTRVSSHASSLTSEQN